MIVDSSQARQILAGEPQAIDEATQDAIAREARERDIARKADANEALFDEFTARRDERHRLRDALRERGLDLRDEFRMIDRAFKGAERKIRAQVTNAKRAAREAD